MSSPTLTSAPSGTPALSSFGFPTPDSSVIATGDNDLSQQELAKLREKKLHGELVNWVKTEYQKCKNQTTGIRNQWYMNLAFYKGEQYVAKMAGSVMKTRAPSRRVRLVINRVRPMIRTELAKMTGQDPTAECIPASTDDEDLLAAETAQSVFENISIEKKLKERYQKTAFWQSNLGIGYIKTYWDGAGDGGIGCIEYSALSPFHVHVPELLTEDIEDQPYVLNTFTKPIQWVKDNFPGVVPADHKPTVVSTNEIMETQYLNLSNSDRRAEPDSCLFIEAWIKPGTHKDLPQGGLITVVDDFIIQACLDGMSYSHNMYPFTKFEGVPSGGYYPTSATEDFIPIQMELNRNRSQRSEARNLTSRPQWVAQKGSIDVSKWRNEPGQVLEYNMGTQRPEPLPINPLPNYVIQEEENILRDMEDVSGQHQVSKGKAPAGVTAGTAINFLQEADNSFMATVFFSIERGFEKIAKQTIMLAVQYWDTPRIVKITGRDGTFSVKSLLGADLKNGTDIRIESGSSLPVSRAARNAMFMDMLNKGALPPDVALKMMKLPNMKAYFDRVEIDQNQARRENQKIRELTPQQLQQAAQTADGMKQELMAKFGMNDPAALANSPVGSQIEAMFNQPVIGVNDFDNHEAHIAEHSYYMKSQSYESLPPETQDQYKKHLQAHKDAMMQGQMNQLMQQGQPDPNAPQDGPPGMPPGMPPMPGADPNAGPPGANPPGNQFAGMPPQDSSKP